MTKIAPVKPILILLYGFPGSGKTLLAQQLASKVQAAHIYGDRIRNELFEQPRYDKTENDIVEHLMEYMAEEFLDAGVSVIFDNNTARKSKRRMLRTIARKKKAESLLIWLQIDKESAFMRAAKRDRRKSEDKYSMPIDKAIFNQQAGLMQNPGLDEEYLVLSGKHAFNMQQSAIIRKLYDMKLLSAEALASKVIKPGMINLIPPAAGRVDFSRRNITIR